MRDQPRQIVHIDGGCGLCSSFARFVSNRDKGRLFEFVPDNKTDSVLVVEGGCTYSRSTAVLRVLTGLGFPWSWIGRITALIPAPLRDAAYDWVARHRHGPSCRID